jgi:hypothetical protein
VSNAVNCRHELFREPFPRQARPGRQVRENEERTSEWSRQGEWLDKWGYFAIIAGAFIGIPGGIERISLTTTAPPSAAKSFICELGKAEGVAS